MQTVALRMHRNCSKDEKENGGFVMSSEKEKSPSVVYAPLTGKAVLLDQVRIRYFPGRFLVTELRSFRRTAGS